MQDVTSTLSLDDANCWCISGVRSAEKFFRAIPRLAAEVTHMFLEGAPTPDIVALISDHAEQSQYWGPGGTIWLRIPGQGDHDSGVKMIRITG